MESSGPRASAPQKLALFMRKKVLHMAQGDDAR